MINEEKDQDRQKIIKKKIKKLEVNFSRCISCDVATDGLMCILWQTLEFLPTGDMSFI